MQTRKQGGAEIPKAGEAASLAEIGKAVSDICGTVAEAVRILRRIDQKAAPYAAPTSTARTGGIRGTGCTPLASAR